MPYRIYVPARFLVLALANYKGWALFCDPDIVFLKDVKELFDQAEDKYAVMCVQHDYTYRRNKNGWTKTNVIIPRKIESQWFYITAVIPKRKINVDLVNNPKL